MYKPKLKFTLRIEMLIILFFLEETASAIGTNAGRGKLALRNDLPLVKLSGSRVQLLRLSETKED